LADAGEVARLTLLTGPIDAVVHCAALSAPWGKPLAFERANVTATANVIELVRRTGANRLVHVSTPSIYFQYMDQLGVRETAPLPPPVNLYAATKRQGEELVREAAGIERFILRPRGIYGAGDTALLPRLVRAAADRPLPLLRGGNAVTDLTYVGDVAEAILAALDAPAAAAGTYNISGGEPLRLVDVIGRACACSGVTARWRPRPIALALAAARSLEWTCRTLPGRPEPPITAYGIGLLAYSQTLDLGATRRALGWSPRISFEHGLQLTFGDAARAA
jgi:nucleoside-diphosphate-sugar epimerase